MVEMATWTAAPKTPDQSQNTVDGTVSTAWRKLAIWVMALPWCIVLCGIYIKLVEPFLSNHSHIMALFRGSGHDSVAGKGNGRTLRMPTITVFIWLDVLMSWVIAHENKMVMANLKVAITCDHRSVLGDRLDSTWHVVTWSLSRDRQVTKERSEDQLYICLSAEGLIESLVIGQSLSWTSASITSDTSWKIGNQWTVSRLSTQRLCTASCSDVLALLSFSMLLNARLVYYFYNQMILDTY